MRTSFADAVRNNSTPAPAHVPRVQEYTPIKGKWLLFRVFPRLTPECQNVGISGWTVGARGVYIPEFNHKLLAEVKSLIWKISPSPRHCSNFQSISKIRDLQIWKFPYLLSLRPAERDLSQRRAISVRSNQQSVVWCNFVLHIPQARFAASIHTRSRRSTIC